MTILIACKRAPEFKQLQKAIAEGFENVEIYLEERHLDNFGFALENIRLAQREASKVINRNLNVVAVHTPHVGKDKIAYINKTIELAKNFDSWVVLHSGKIDNMAELAEEGKIAKYDKIAIENKHEHDIRGIMKEIVGRNFFLCLDTAHFYIGSKNFFEEFDLLLEGYADKIRIIHLSDATKAQDGLPIGDGDIEMGLLCNKLQNSSFQGIVTIEVPVDSQLESYSKVKRFFEQEKPKPRKLGNIKAVIFDADNTLYEINAGRAYDALYSYLSEKLQIPKEEIEKEHKEETEFMKKSQNPKSRDYKSAIRKIVEAHAKENVALVTEEANAKFWNIAIDDLKEKPLVKEVVEKLSSKYILGIASDEFRAILERKLQKIFGKRWQTYFDIIITNEDTKIMKPSVEYYKRIMQKMDLKSDDLIVIGDSWRRDLKPAKELGIKTVLVSNIPDGNPDHFYTSIGGLEEIVEM